MNKNGRYERLHKQISELIPKGKHSISAMATISSVLYHKMEYFFWCGFYFVDNDELKVGPYQGPVACQILEKDKGVCWAGINQNKSILVPDVHAFPGHIACDSRSQSEVVIPVRNAEGIAVAVLDIDSDKKDVFDKTDVEWLEKIISLIEPIQL
ncbi:MAG: histidine kinase [Marinilabiliales bacterium]|nr:MAG: histidine kinase [Marinilabiliales bacterium]